jgi:hypothetical protein
MTEGRSEPPDNDPPPSERRKEERRLSCIPASLQASEDDDLALIRNVSRTGALLFTRIKYEIGDQLTLSLHLTGLDDGLPARATVVRVVARDYTRKDLWRYEVGVNFEEPIDGYAEQIREIGDRQAELGLFKRSSKPPPPES